MNFGVKRELCDLMRLPSMESHTARLLYDGGLVNISSVATARRENITFLLQSARQFKTEKEKKNGNIVDAQSIIVEGRELVQLELAGVEIRWDH